MHMRVSSLLLGRSLIRKGRAPPGTEVECVQLRSWVAGLEDELVGLTQSFATLDHT